MKREEAVLMLKNYLDKEEYTVEKHEIPFVTRHFADIVIEFLENEIGMSAPLRNVIKRLPLKERSWEPETSDREREFQSKKDSCI